MEKRYVCECGCDQFLRTVTTIQSVWVGRCGELESIFDAELLNYEIECKDCGEIPEVYRIKK